MNRSRPFSSFFFFNDTATTEIYTLSLHDALPIYNDGFRALPASSANTLSETNACARNRTLEWTQNKLIPFYKITSHPEKIHTLLYCPNNISKVGNQIIFSLHQRADLREKRGVFFLTGCAFYKNGF